MKMSSARRRPPRAGSSNRDARSSEADRSSQDGRPAFRPPAKKGAHPGVVIGTLVLFLVSGVFFVYSLVNRSDEVNTVVIETDTNTEYNIIKRRIIQSKTLVREVVQLRSDDDTERFSRKWTEANEYAGTTLDMLRAMTAPVRNPEGALPDEYSGYNIDFTQLQTLINDLIHVAPLDGDWDVED
ncbi:MAG: hypothetical protein VX949_05160 [Planctomycetota bacterium]|nr:hypothetical protein [Planctomycetota bacterium]